MSIELARIFDAFAIVSDEKVICAGDHFRCGLVLTVYGSIRGTASASSPTEARSQTGIIPIRQDKNIASASKLLGSGKDIVSAHGDIVISLGTTIGFPWVLAQETSSVRKGSKDHKDLRPLVIPTSPHNVNMAHVISSLHC